MLEGEFMLTDEKAQTLLGLAFLIVVVWLVDFDGDEGFVGIEHIALALILLVVVSLQHILNFLPAGIAMPQSLFNVIVDALAGHDVRSTVVAEYASAESTMVFPDEQWHKQFLAVLAVINGFVVNPALTGTEQLANCCALLHTPLIINNL